MNGKDIKIVAETQDDFGYPYIHVNITGIYMYYVPMYGGLLLVKHFDFMGKLLVEFRKEYKDGDEISNIYIYDNNLYYVHKSRINDKCKYKIECIHVDSKSVEILYEKATSIEKLYATG